MPTAKARVKLIANNPTTKSVAPNNLPVFFIFLSFSNSDTIYLNYIQKFKKSIHQFDKLKIIIFRHIRLNPIPVWNKTPWIVGSREYQSKRRLKWILLMELLFRKNHSGNIKNTCSIFDHCRSWQVQAVMEHSFLADPNSRGWGRKCRCQDLRHMPEAWQPDHWWWWSPALLTGDHSTYKYYLPFWSCNPRNKSRFYFSLANKITYNNGVAAKFQLIIIKMIPI